jgi:transcriptional regulator with XRE-family HTH domain
VTQLNKKILDTQNIEFRKIMGARLKEARTKAGLSQKEVNEKMGYRSSATVSHHESGLKSPKAIDMPKLAEMYNVSVGWIFVEDFKWKGLTKPNDFTAEEKQLIENFRKASNKDKEIAKSLLEPEEEKVLSFSS